MSLRHGICSNGKRSDTRHTGESRYLETRFTALFFRFQTPAFAGVTGNYPFAVFP